MISTLNIPKLAKSTQIRSGQWEATRSPSSSKFQVHKAIKEHRREHRDHQFRYPSQKKRLVRSRRKISETEHRNVCVDV